MSLVAAYSGTDEEESSDEGVKNPKIVTESANERCNEKKTHFSDLPTPKNYQIIEEEQDDEFIKIKPKVDKERGFMNLPKPTKISKKNSVKIYIPSLFERDSDSDEDVQKTISTTVEKKCSLLTMLPKPKRSVQVCDNKNKVFKKETNRILVPHTLTKRQIEKRKHIGNENEGESDEEEEENSTVSFFSLEENQKTNVMEKQIESSELKKETLKVPVNCTQQNDVVSTNESITNAKGNHYFASLFPKTVEKPTQATTCGVTAPSVTYIEDNDVTAPYEIFSNEVAQPETEKTIEEDDPPPFFQCAYNKRKTDDVDYYNQANIDGALPPDALDALVGKKRRKHETVNIIDISAQDLQTSNEEFLKNLSKEKAYKPKDKDEEPKAVAKRKHQITYLAFEAKQKELELREAWANSRATRQQTQSRYGF